MKSAQVEVRLKLAKRGAGAANAIQRALSNGASSYFSGELELEMPWALTQAQKARNYALTAQRYRVSWRDDGSLERMQNATTLFVLCAELRQLEMLSTTRSAHVSCLGVSGAKLKPDSP